MKRILIVEDCKYTSAIMQEILERRGYKIDLASNGAEGLALARSNNYDLIITDLEMPIMDGTELIRKLRDTDKNKTSIIIISAYCKQANKDFAEVYDCGFLIKPFDAETVIKAVRDEL